MKKIIGLLLLTLLLAGCSAGNNSNESTEKGTVADTTSNVKTYRQIKMNEALDIMESESDYIILDVRRPDEFADGHILGAINLPNENIGKDEISKLPDKNQLILVYCRSGRRSKEASSKLVELGYSNIVEFGGILDWNGETEVGN